MPKTGRFHWPVIIAASAVLHALALWLISDRAPFAPPPPRPARLVLVPVEPTSVTPPLAPAPPRPQKGSPVTTSNARRAQTPTSSPVGPPAGPSVAVAGAGRVDVPRAQAPGLTPSAGLVYGLMGTAASEPSRGATLRNGPGEVIDEAIAREVEGERLTRRLDRELLGDVGAAAVGAGTAPAHFRRAESTMRAALAGQELDRTPLAGKSLVEDVAKTLFAPGISDSAARRVADSPLGASVQRQAGSVPNTDDNRFREQGLQLMAGVEALKERARAVRLKTVLQLTTDPTGAVAEVTVVERSGDPRFDESVLHLSRKVFRRLPEDDEKALGTAWWQTKWQFTWEPPDVRVRLIDAHRLPASP